MNMTIGKWLPVLAAAFVAVSFVIVSEAEAARGGGGGGARGGGGGSGAAARGGGGGGGDGGARQGAQVNNSRADARSSDVRNTSVNNVNASRDVNVNVDCSGRCGGWDHPVAATAVVAGTAAAVGAAVATPPPSCYVDGVLAPCPY